MFFKLIAKIVRIIAEGIVAATIITALVLGIFEGLKAIL